MVVRARDGRRSGHGRSDRPHDPAAYSLEALGWHTVAVLDSEGIDEADVWGYSRGALLVVALMQHHGLRIRSAVAGGVDLAALTSRGSVSAERRQATALLRQADWAGFWELFPTLVPPARRADVERSSDPLALAAAMEAGESFSIKVDPTTFRAMVYVGAAEPFVGSTWELAGRIGLPCKVLPTGDHSSTFDAVDTVCSTVERFLDGS